MSDKNNDTFKKEEEFLRKLKEQIEQGSIPADCAQSIIKEISDNYEKLLKDVKLLTSVSDRLQAREIKYKHKIQEQKAKIQKYNRELRRKNAELQKTIEELTKARAGRKATTIVLVLALILFFISESLENIIDNWTQGHSLGNLWSWIFKAIIAILFKPVESGLESYFVNRALKESYSQNKQTQEKPNAKK